MRWLRWFTRNWATTDNASLTAPVLPLALAPALVHVEAAIRGLRRWEIVRVKGDQLTLHATHTTRLLRFVDDVVVRLEPTAEGTRVHVRSQSRGGVGDLGQNARNIRELLAAL